MTTEPSDSTEEADRISVVIPTRNRRALLERLLGQLLRPEVAPSHEVIVVDEASSDDTPALLERLSGEGRITAISNDPPLKLSGARNCGIAAATGRYVAWIDDDDLTAPDRLIRQREALVSSGLRWSCAATVDIDDDLNVIGHKRCPPSGDVLARLLAFNCIPAAAQGLLVERSLADEVGGFDPALPSAEDWDFCIRLAAVGRPYLLDEPLVGYRIGYASMSTDTDRMELAISQVYAKHADLRSKHEVEPDWASVHQSLLSGDLLTSRRNAARRAVKLLRCEPSAKNLARTLAIAAVPRSFAAHAATRRREQVPNAWRVQAEAWLGQVESDLDVVLDGDPDRSPKP